MEVVCVTFLVARDQKGSFEVKLVMTEGGIRLKKSHHGC